MTATAISRSHARTTARTLARLVAALMLLLISVTVLPLMWWRAIAPASDGYNYASFAEANASAFVRAGELFPADAELQTPNGHAVEVASLSAERPLVLETGSLSCPIYRGGADSMGAISHDYGDRVSVALLYTREAHPGTFARPHRSLADKRSRAGELAAMTNSAVYVDTLDGALHRQLGGGPNSVYVVGTDGVVAYYGSLNNPGCVRAALDALLANGGRARRVEPVTRLCPDLDEAGLDDGEVMRMVAGIVRVGGPDALLDFVLTGRAQTTPRYRGNVGSDGTRPMATTSPPRPRSASRFAR